MTTTLSTLPKIHNHTLSHRRSFLSIPVNPAEKLVRFLHSFLPDPSSYSCITYALERQRPQICTWENCGMATGVVVVKSRIPDKAFLPSLLFLFYRAMQAASKTFAPWGMEIDPANLISCPGSLTLSALSAFVTIRILAIYTARSHQQSPRSNI